MSGSTGSDRGRTPELVDHLFRTQAGRLVAHFTRRFGPAHLDLAEEVVQDALVKALQRWPWTGVPENPEGWLFRVACHGALDVLRRRRAFGAKADAIARALAADRRDVGTGRLDVALADDELRMVLMCCHPDLPDEARVALSLRTVGGLSVAEIARALLADPRAIAQRLVRAKRRIRDLGLTFDLPAGAAIAARVDAALDVIYLLFNEGYGAYAGDDLIRADLCREALRLGRLVAGAPDVSTPRAHALVALMAFHAARLSARVGPGGELVLLEDQDRSCWDDGLIALGFRHLDASLAGDEQTSFHLQAGIAATHASAADAASTDWPRILDLYDELVAIDPSPVVRLNRAVAISRVRGPRAALPVVAALGRQPVLRRYYLLPAVRADLLAQCRNLRAARRAYREALARPCSQPERRFLERRLAAVGGG